MIFQSLMGLGKLRCDIPIVTTQGHDYLLPNFTSTHISMHAMDKNEEKNL
jgi:hypothetical protein